MKHTHTVGELRSIIRKELKEAIAAGYFNKGPNKPPDLPPPVPDTTPLEDVSGDDPSIKNSSGKSQLALVVDSAFFKKWRADLMVSCDVTVKITGLESLIECLARLEDKIDKTGE
jgi:hypothetical protein